MEGDTDEVIVYVGSPGEGTATGAGDTWSVVGAEPCWGLHQDTTHTNTIPKCSSCKEELQFVCQVYAPVDDLKHRTLYIFGCNAAACHGLSCWYVLRLERLESPDHDAKTEQTSDEVAGNGLENITQQLSTMQVNQPSAIEESSAASSTWGKPFESNSTSLFASGNSWSKSSFGVDWGASVEKAGVEMDDLESLLNARDARMKETKKSSKTKKKKVHKGETGPRFGKLLDIYEEPEPVEADMDHVATLLQRYNDEQRELGEEQVELATAMSVSSKGGDEDDADEVTDEQQDLFQSRLEREPSQCLRYAYGGKPLWPSDKSVRAASTYLSNVPACSGCGSPRVFELQLVPGVLWHLQQALDHQARSKGEVSSGVHMDWSSVHVFSCPQSCAYSHEEYAFAVPPL